MENQEDYSVLSRAELIQLARESCTKNMSSAVNSRNINSSSKKVIRKEARKFEQRSTEPINENLGEASIINLRFFVIRMVCAVMLFLAVFIIDNFKISFKELNSEFIQQCISTNQGIEDAENFVVTCFEQIVKD